MRSLLERALHDKSQKAASPLCVPFEASHISHEFSVLATRKPEEMQPVTAGEKLLHLFN